MVAADRDSESSFFEDAERLADEPAPARPVAGWHPMPADKPEALERLESRPAVGDHPAVPVPTSGAPAQRRPGFGLGMMLGASGAALVLGALLVSDDPRVEAVRNWIHAAARGTQPPASATTMASAQAVEVLLANRAMRDARITAAAIGIDWKPVDFLKAFGPPDIQGALRDIPIWTVMKWGPFIAADESSGKPAEWFRLELHVRDDGVIGSWQRYRPVELPDRGTVAVVIDKVNALEAVEELKRRGSGASLERRH